MYATYWSPFEGPVRGGEFENWEKGNFKGVHHPAKFYFVQQVLFNRLGFLESRGEALSLTGKPRALVAYPETKAEAMTQKINKLFVWVSLKKSVEEGNVDRGDCYLTFDDFIGLMTPCH